MVSKEIRLLSVAKLVKKTRLVGSAMGRNDYGLFASEMSGRHKEVLCFDWSQVELATGSYLKAAYLPIFRAPNGVPIFTSGLNGETRDELELALQTEARPIFLLEPKKKGKQETLAFLGDLDDAYRRTLAALSQHERASASDLYFKSLGEVPQIGKTAWINRLNRLYEMGLIDRSKAGKGYQYSTIGV
jgi:hypothetical protein